jgi:hypothetical protein
LKSLLDWLEFTDLARAAGAGDRTARAALRIATAPPPISF